MILPDTLRFHEPREQVVYGTLAPAVLADEMGFGPYFFDGIGWASRKPDHFEQGEVR